MKSHSIGALGAASFATAAAAFATGTASAQVLGLTATTRLQSDGNYLVNVWVVVGSSTNVLTSVSGGQIGSITTNAVGGFRQGAGTQGVWAPAGSQNWNTLDSFLTGGGGFLTSSNSWTGNSNTVGDPNWNVTYFDTDLEENQTINAFNNASNASGFTNPYGNGATAIAPAGGWNLPGGTNSPARSLATLTALGRQNADAQGQAAGSAAAGTFGIMIAQLYVSGQTASGAGAKIFFNNMRVFLGNTDNRLIESFVLLHIPAPGAIALLGIARLAGGRRRTA
jgi:hypothetical protein